MTGWFNPDSWMDVVSQILLVLGALGVAVVPSWLSFRSHRTITDIKDQVVNGHKTPLRADLDKALAAIEALAHDVRGIRQDLANEEDRRRVQISELRDDLDRRSRH